MKTLFFEARRIVAENDHVTGNAPTVVRLARLAYTLDCQLERLREPHDFGCLFYLTPVADRAGKCDCGAAIRNEKLDGLRAMLDEATP